TLKEFPEELRGDVSMHLHREILQLPIFEAASQGCLKLLSLHIRNNFCAPGEYLIHKWDALSYIYYICNGSMEVVQNNMVVAILGKGDLVGSDINLHLQHSSNGPSTDQGRTGASSDIIIKSSSDVRALTYCDLKCIHMQGLVDVLRLYPEYQQQFANDIQHDLTFNVREGYEAEQESDANGMPSLTLPSISEDDENVHEEGESSPLSPNRSPMHVVRNAIQALQEMTTPSSCGGSVHYSVHSNPNLHHSGSGNGILARSTSHPPEMFYWEESNSPPLTFRPFPTYVDRDTQTDNELLRRYVTQNPRQILEMLGLDPDKILNKANMRKSHSIPDDKGQVHLSVRNQNCFNCSHLNDIAVDIDEETDEGKGEECPFLWDQNAPEARNFQVFEAINPQNSLLKFKKPSHAET
ncbi:potassium voltage-gated channel subfamily H member 8, partial [Asbolus verrucosus]